ncbi:PhiH1 repressor [Natronocalculus amylovorans]|uniref:PhiH1 repressor n=1 Tax=Natronocalculus amylovorans TaxID=2917812 RepID=A0AAE3FZV4_9EURY|nr:PhiH1 repressor [Natronocalculus amylovorans]MCL9818379.1 PhiH1 repressor [Natronocalculus amylovorans]
MSVSLGLSGNMRKTADWMTQADDRILELIRDEGNLTPSAIEHLGGPVRQYASERATLLAQYGLLEVVYRGLYRLTDNGHAYLDEDLDANKLEPVNSE